MGEGASFSFFSRFVFHLPLFSIKREFESLLPFSLTTGFSKFSQFSHLSLDVLYFSFCLLANIQLAEPFEKSCQTVASARKRIIIPPLSSSIRDVVGKGDYVCYVPYMCRRCHMLRQTSRTANFEKEVNKMRKSEGKL